MVIDGATNATTAVAVAPDRAQSREPGHQQDLHANIDSAM